MDHYLEIKLPPDPEFVPTVLMNALFRKLHRALVELNNTGIGVSFPDVQPDRPTLGERLRLHGSADNLERLMARNWLTEMNDHVTLGELKHIPGKVSHRIVRRVQAKSSPERLRRRLIKRKGISEEEARRAIPDTMAKQLSLPFVVIKSRSTVLDKTSGSSSSTKRLETKRQGENSAATD